MKINFEFDMDSKAVELLDNVTLAILKRIRKDLKSWKKGYIHPDDIKQNKELVKAATLLIKYYGGVPDA